MRTLLCILACLLACARASAAEDWPRWLGPNGDNISRERLALEKLPSGGPKQLWSKRVGIGHSSPVAADGRVYLFTLVGNQDTLTCFDAKTGDVVWTRKYNAGWKGAYPGTRATPVIEKEEGRIYTYGGAGHLVCYELETGKPVWALDVLKETRSRPLQWGQASSPLVVDDLIYVQAGDGGPVAVAVNKKNGRVAWQSQARDKAGYAHVIHIDAGGTPQLVVFGGKAVYGVNPDNGRTLWREPWETSYDVNAATPVYRDGHLFVSSEYGHGCMMLRVERRGVRKLWEKRDVQCKFQPPILDGDHLYANSAGTIKCMSWPDGRIAWEARDRDLRLGAGGSILRVGEDKLITLSERGELGLVEATPQRIRLLGQAQLFDGREIWSTPLLYDGKLYAKGTEGFVCLDMGGGRE
ncbi:MAG TPA: PQQ-binding-like beta-propeller repeat protein [Tepidisphaeraceae bacterium]|nr:PQQ-binding-like beta-propeller repeat protein [Tepidisphaeraceae bacterium]